jgi:hypothetical protein
LPFFFPVPPFFLPIPTEGWEQEKKGKPSVGIGGEKRAKGGVFCRKDKEEKVVKVNQGKMDK